MNNDRWKGFLDGCGNAVEVLAVVIAIVIIYKALFKDMPVWPL